VTHPSVIMKAHLLERLEMNKLICDLCGQETHDDSSDVFDIFYGDGMTQERHCFDCDPADEEVM